MGKKCRGRREKTCSILELKSLSSEIFPLMQATIHTGSMLLKHNTSSTILELQKAIMCIYKALLDDFKVREQRRLRLKVPTQHTHPYILIVSDTHQSFLRSKVSELVLNNYRSSLEIIIDETLEYFIEILRRFIEGAEEKSRLLQVVYIHEAYHSLRNAISQISSIFAEVYMEDQFINLSIKKFYENILLKYKKILKFAKTQDFTHYAISFILKLYDNAEICMQSGTYNSARILMDCENSVESIAEAVHGLPLDDLLNYINGPTNKRVEKWESQKYTAPLDKEILDFEKKLANAKPVIEKPVPLCSLEFIRSLTDRYHEVRRDLLSN